MTGVRIQQPGNSRRIALRCSAWLLATLCAVSAAAQLPVLNAPDSGLSLPGKFVWFDLASPDIAQQKSFYRNLFGWTFRPVAGAGDAYAVVESNGRAIAGIFSYEPEDGSGDAANWIVLMSVPDPDQAARAVKANGGAISVGPTDVPDRGRHALFEDPGGALFGVLRSSSGDPPDRRAGIGDIMWVDLFSLDPDRALAFYRALVPYETERRPVTDTLARTLLYSQGKARASVIPVAEDANRSSWVPYVRVANVEATLAKVVDGGGFAIVPPDPDLLDGNLAVFVDPNGAVMGIVKWDYEQAAGR